MLTLRNVPGLIFMFTLVLSCGREATNNKEAAKQETPEALQNGKLDIKSYGRSGDLVEEIYQELAEKNPALKRLEEDLLAFKSAPLDAKNKFNEYDGKSNKYYQAAQIKAGAISDSLLRKKINALIDDSRKQYVRKSTDLNSLLKQMDDNNTTISDHHTVLKIVLTLPFIEKYQDQNKPDLKEFRNLFEQQKALILRADSLCPEY